MPFTSHAGRRLPQPPTHDASASQATAAPKYTHSYTDLLHPRSGSGMTPPPPPLHPHSSLSLDLLRLHRDATTPPPPQPTRSFLLAFHLRGWSPQRLHRQRLLSRPPPLPAATIASALMRFPLALADVF
nr:hypothetical protein Iba_chr02eCG6770 [Ipomoea batatas]